ncbi:MAG: IS5 family transposase [Candidatus Aenigmatarchaeota archaeon]
MNSESRLKKFTSAVLGIAKKSMPEYSSKFSRKDFTLHQHCAMLCLKVRTKQKFRDFCDLLSEMTEICKLLGLEKLPHFTTLDKAFLRMRNSIFMILLYLSAGEAKDCSIDATGFDRRYASKHYVKRAKMTLRSLKVTLLVNVENLRIVDVHATTTRKHDSKIILPLTEKYDIDSLRADKGYDDRKVRDILRDRGIRPLIPHREFKNIDKANNARLDKDEYNKRAFSETVNSMLKRKYADYVSSKNWWNQFKEIRLMCFVHNIDRSLVIVVEGFYKAVII